MARARKLGKPDIFGGRADELTDVRPRMGPGWLATGKFGSKTKYLAKLGLSGLVSEPETAKTENKNPKISGGRPVPRSTGVTRVGFAGYSPKSVQNRPELGFA